MKWKKFCKSFFCSKCVRERKSWRKDRRELKKYRERERESQTGLLTLLTNWFVRNSVDETEICFQMFYLLSLFRFRPVLTSLIKQSFIRDSWLKEVTSWVFNFLTSWVVRSFFLSDTPAKQHQSDVTTHAAQKQGGQVKVSGRERRLPW